MANVDELISSHLDDKIDMIAATSVLQQQASDIRMQKINWQSYNQSQMISNEDYQAISALDSEKKGQYLKDQTFQSAKTFLNLLSHVSKDTTIQYLLVMIDDLLSEDRTRVEIFLDYASKRKENIWAPFLSLLNRSDGFIINMSSRILAKLACWGTEQMPKSDVHFYLQWLKDQLVVTASAFAKELEELSKHSVHKSREQHHHHHGMHLFHLPGHHSHHKEHGQQQVSGEKYREVSSAIDEPANRAHASSAPSTHFKLTVGRLERE